MIRQRLLARCQVAVWAIEECTSSPEKLAAAPMGQFMADLGFVMLASVLGLQPLWIDKGIWAAFGSSLHA